MSDATKTLPKLHNAMWPGLVGKGDEEGQEPPNRPQSVPSARPQSSLQSLSVIRTICATAAHCPARSSCDRA